MTYCFLQEYWWLLISLLGSLLVFLLFVQGGQSMILRMPQAQKEPMLHTLAKRWDLTFTTLVVFGGAFFASFPLFYSTSFGGAYWVWVIILLGFVLQAVSYKYREKEGNLLGKKTYDLFLLFNGVAAPLLLGAAVATFFYGGDFRVEKVNIVGETTPYISQWGPWHGLEALADWRVVVFGLMVLMLTRVQANLWFINQVDDDEAARWNGKQLLVNALVFVVLYLVSLIALLLASGYEAVGLNEFEVVQYKYWNNLLACPFALVFLLLGTLLVLYALFVALVQKKRSGIWFSGLGTVMVVLALFWMAGYNNTPFYPSLADMNSSLTIRNSSSSLFTLKTMFYVSLFLPVVLGYIAWTWKKLHSNSK